MINYLITMSIALCLMNASQASSSQKNCKKTKVLVVKNYRTGKVIFSEERDNRIFTISLIRYDCSGYDKDYSLKLQWQNEPASFLSCARYEYNTLKKCAYLTMLLTHENHRSKGYGSILMKQLCSWLYDKKVHYLDLHVEKNNTRAITFYKRHKFNLIDDKESPYSTHNNENVLVMRKYIIKD